MKKILIANRGEIACRIIKTARRMGLQTVAVYSDADRHAYHVKLADESYRIGGSMATDSYLNRESILSIAKQAEVDAIHPGYGFLSEDPKFAELCVAGGILFIGPPAEAIKAMGDKRQAKALMIEAGVPVVPGYQGDAQDPKTLQREAQKIGFPLLLKASAGGGGKGMRLVTAENQLKEAVLSAQREALAHFGDDNIFIEKWIHPARHVEVQIFFDTHGNGVYLFDRDCSLQRRHQKIIEEAPAPHLEAQTRERMGKTAVNAGHSIHYVGAGTLEFLLGPDGNFYFMEMNTRLQVEHPITEMITGIDLVEWQLRIAQGEALPMTQERIHCRGHALEARLYAENPDKQFLPSVGTLKYFITPPEDAHTRVDSGVVQGDSLTPYYDPLMAKLVVFDTDRDKALARLKSALEKVFIVGVESNVVFLHKICNIPDFQQGLFNTDFIEEHRESLRSQDQAAESTTILAGALAFLLVQKRTMQRLAAEDEDMHSPWFKSDHWRLSGETQELRFWCQNQLYSVFASRVQNTYSLQYDHKLFSVYGELDDDHRLRIFINEQSFQFTVLESDDSLHLFYQGEHVTLHDVNTFTTAHEAALHNQFMAPMPGTVVAVLVKPGQSVQEGDRLLILEAMKMEHTVHAPSKGVVESILCNPGDLVDEGAELIKFRPV